MKSFKALVVGCGAQGRVISAHLAKSPDVDEIRLSDTDLETCKRHADWLKSDKVSVHRVDASKIDQLISLAKGVDLTINALIPAFNLNIMDASLRSGADYIDLAFGPPYENLDSELERDSKFKDAGLVALTGTGNAPGLSNVLAARAADQLDTVDGIYVRVCSWLEAKELISTWSPRTLIEDCASEAVVLENGELKKVAPFSGEERYTFPDPDVGVQTVWHHLHEEPFMFSRTMKGKGLRNCSVKLGGLGGFKSLFDRGLLSCRPIDVGGVSVVPWEVVASATPLPPSEDELRQMIDNGVIVTSHGNTVVEVSGQKDGETQRHVLWSPYPGVREVMKTYPMANQTSYMASTNGVVLALILGRGESKVVGVTMPELLEPEVRQKYLAELAKQDPPIIAYERVEKRIR